MRFALIGAAGYVAPRHMQAIKDMGGELVAALDPHDSVGVLDRYFPGCQFFTEFERFDRHCEMLRREDRGVDYVSICSPNYLHDAHCRFAMRIGAAAICEKPLALHTHNLLGLEGLEREMDPGCPEGGRHQARLFSILQLRLHPEIIAFRERLVGGMERGAPPVKVRVIYTAPRGAWYSHSWKGDGSKSGGLITNIGVHLLDLLCWFFGWPQGCVVKTYTPERVECRLDVVPGAAFGPGAEAEIILSTVGPAERSITIGEESLEFSNGITDLHTLSYAEILAGRGFGVREALPAIEACEMIREAGKRPGKTVDYHFLGEGT
ncbi:MAG: Gfo/Idh/MocA family oxidoreductase [Deltaproteobacteria bacterium]|nr:Gfo/Idh/MocA family oxidoreductase [Deltaproteobacteria bacterium]